jgi:putative FmdB family regulatory protein
MPIYEFRCLQCNRVFELLALRKDDTVEMKCPECQSSEIERIMSRANVVAGSNPSEGPAVTNRKCSSGTCSTIEFPGFERK